MATTKATTLAHTLGGISSDISTAEINRLDGVTGDLQTQLDAKAPTASPTFTGTITAPNDSISGDAVSGGTIGAGTFNGTVGSNAIFPAGIALQTVRDDYASQTEASSTVKLHELTLTTKKANSKLAYFFSTALGGYGDADNILLQMTLETGATANSPSSSNFLPTTNRASGTSSQAYGRQFYLDVPVTSNHLPSYQMLIYGSNDLITTSYAKDTQITMGVFIQGGCWINRPTERANTESGLTTLIVQEIAT